MFKAYHSAAVVMLLASTAPSEAALSGFYDSAEQISTILSSQEVGDALRQAPIGALSNSGTRADGAHEWTITVQECDLLVYLTPVAPDGPGKTTYQIDIPKRCE